MDENDNIVNLGPWLEEHSKLWEYCWQIYKLEKALSNDEFRYLYLVSLISSDSMVDVKSTQECLDRIIFLNQNVKYMNLDNEIIKEVINYTNKGIKIANRDLILFKIKEEKKNENNG